MNRSLFSSAGRRGMPGARRLFGPRAMHPRPRTERLATALDGRGFSLVHFFSVVRANARLDPVDRLPLGDRDDALGVVVGSTRSLWPAFSGARSRGAADSADPLDDYVREAVLEELDALDVAAPWVRFAHEGPPFFPIQRVAAAAGLGTLAPAQLVVDAEHGPWLALRALALFDVDPPDELHDSPPLPANACADCSAPCVPALRSALAENGPVPEVVPALASLGARARRFLAVREVCPLGRAERYSDEQILFHYSALERSGPGPTEP